jgi:hypothetical protein
VTVILFVWFLGLLGLRAADNELGSFLEPELATQLHGHDVARELSAHLGELHEPTHGAHQPHLLDRLAVHVE